MKLVVATIFDSLFSIVSSVVIVAVGQKFPQNTYICGSYCRIHNNKSSDKIKSCDYYYRDGFYSSVAIIMDNNVPFLLFSMTTTILDYGGWGQKKILFISPQLIIHILKGLIIEHHILKIIF